MMIKPPDKIYFAPGLVETHIRVHVVKDDEEARKIIPDLEKGLDGACVVPPQHNGDEYCKIVLKNTSLGLVTHELMHAVQSWVCNITLPNAAMAGEDLGEYYPEALAYGMQTVMEQFFGEPQSTEFVKAEKKEREE